MNEFTINMCRGDTNDIVFSIRADDFELSIAEIYFTVKRYPNDKKKLIQKRLSSGEIAYYEDLNCYKFRIEPSDTNQLSFGKYVCDIEISTENNDIVRTFNGILYVDKEVTSWSDKT